MIDFLSQSPWLGIAAIALGLFVGYYASIRFLISGWIGDDWYHPRRNWPEFLTGIVFAIFSLASITLGAISFFW